MNYIPHIAIIVYALVTGAMILYERYKKRNIFGSSYIYTIGFIVVYTVFLIFER